MCVRVREREHVRVCLCLCVCVSSKASSSSSSSSSSSHPLFFFFFASLLFPELRFVPWFVPPHSSSLFLSLSLFLGTSKLCVPCHPHRSIAVAGVGAMKLDWWQGK